MPWMYGITNMCVRQGVPNLLIIFFFYCRITAAARRVGFGHFSLSMCCCEFAGTAAVLNNLAVKESRLIFFSPDFQKSKLKNCDRLPPIF